MQEIWKDIKFEEKGHLYNYEGIYQVSNYGRVRTLTHRTRNNHLIKEKFKSLRSDKNGYKITTLTVNGNAKDFKVHRLVAYMFLKNDNNYPIVNHKDENPTNNHVDNLEWCTYKDNINYGSCVLKMSKRVNQYDKNNNFVKTWKSISEAGRDLKIDISSITKCCRGKKKSIGGYKWRYLSE